MNNRRWPWLLLSVSFVLAPRTAPAQIKQSHHDLPGGFDLSNAQEMMAQRLRELRELHQWQDQAQDLLRDPKFIENIKKHFNADQLRQIQANLLKDEGWVQDRTKLQQLLQQAASGKDLNQQQITFLRQLAEHAARKSPSESKASATETAPSLTLPAPTVPSSSTESPFPHALTSPSSLLDRIQEETGQWLMDHLDEMGDEALKAFVELGGNDEGNPVKEWLRAMKQADLPRGNFAERAAGLSNYLPKLSAFLPERGGFWDELGSLFRESPASSLPRFGASSSSTPADDGGWMPAMLSVLTFGVLVLFLCKTIRGSPVGSEPETWRLGSWPVSPSGVSTRRDVIRAFEYLALLCLGPAAGTCHHRALAERLAEQDSGNSSRRQAVETLAWLYEQARYAPANESLSDGELNDARHALCLLAGVTAP